MSVRVLIVDDSRMIRKLLTWRLSQDPGIEVVGCACDASEARQLMKSLDPDVVTLDIEMPGLDGLTFLKKVMDLRPTPVIIVSGATQEGNAITAHALQLGAVSCYCKTNRNGDMPHDDGGELARLVHEASQVNFSRRTPAPPAKTAPSANARPLSDRGRPSLIAVGASTGGVEALGVLLSNFKTNCPPTLVVQHMNARFSAAIVQSLDAGCDAAVEMAENLTIMEAGHVYIAPGGERHLRVAESPSAELRISLRPGDPISGHRPSVDALFHSVAEQMGDKAVGVLLTGMGDDGARGLKAMFDAGAHTIAQDQRSCVVFGMPRAAIALGAADVVMPLSEIGGYLSQRESVA